MLTVAADAQLARRLAQGHALIRAKAAPDFHAEPITLDRKATSAQALFVVASSCLRQIALNQPGVLGGSREGLHQMRVGLRRLRAALSIFERTLKPGEFDDLKRELVWLTEELAGAREFDVLLESHRKFDETRAALAGAAELRSELTHRRHEAFAAAGRAVASARFERLIVSSAVVFLSRADEDGAGGLPVRALARRALKRRTQHVLDGLEGFEQLDVRERHQLRIRVKKLRYGTEYFSSLFAHSRREQARFVRVLEALQETLGRLNDIAVLRAIAAKWVDEGAISAPVSARTAFAMGVFTESEQAGEQSCVAEVAKLRVQLAKAPRFWR